MEPISEKQAVKENAIRLVEHHKQHCDGPDCGVSFYMLGRALELAGIEVTDTEKQEHFS